MYYISIYRLLEYHILSFLLTQSNIDHILAESEKTEEDRLEEKNLLDKLMEVVEKRNNIVNSMEDERVK